VVVVATDSNRRASYCAWDRMQEMMNNTPRPFIVRIDAYGRLDQLFP
jgi:hypothetical protein